MRQSTCPPGLTSAPSWVRMVPSRISLSLPAWVRRRMRLEVRPPCKAWRQRLIWRPTMSSAATLKLVPLAVAEPLPMPGTQAQALRRLDTQPPHSPAPSTAWATPSATSPSIGKQKIMWVCLDSAQVPLFPTWGWSAAAFATWGWSAAACAGLTSSAGWWGTWTTAWSAAATPRAT